MESDLIFLCVTYIFLQDLQLEKCIYYRKVTFHIRGWSNKKMSKYVFGWYGEKKNNTFVGGADLLRGSEFEIWIRHPNIHIELFRKNFPNFFTKMVYFNTSLLYYTFWASDIIVSHQFFSIKVTHILNFNIILFTHIMSNCLLSVADSVKLNLDYFMLVGNNSKNNPTFPKLIFYMA